MTLDDDGKEMRPYDISTYRYICCICNKEVERMMRVPDILNYEIIFRADCHGKFQIRKISPKDYQLLNDLNPFSIEQPFYIESITDNGIINQVLLDRAKELRKRWRFE